MCEPVTAITIASGVLQGVSTIKQMGASGKANDAQNKAMDIQRRADELKQNRERRQVIREARIKRAMIEQGGANQGATTSSAVTGGAAGITSQASGNLSFLDNMGSMNQATTRSLTQANNYTQEAAEFGAMASLGNTVFSSAGGFKTIFSSMFDKKKA